MFFFSFGAYTLYGLKKPENPCDFTPLFMGVGSSVFSHSPWIRNVFCTFVLVTHRVTQEQESWRKSMSCTIKMASVVPSYKEDQFVTYRGWMDTKVKKSCLQWGEERAGYHWQGRRSSESRQGLNPRSLQMTDSLNGSSLVSEKW